MTKRGLFPDLNAVAARHAGAMRATGRLKAFSVAGGMGALLVFALWRLELSLGNLGAGMAQLGTFLGLMFPPSPGPNAALFVSALFETIAIALIGTVGAAILALPFGFLAARNIMPARLVQFLARRFSDTVRGVDTLIWALIWINVVGLGPFAGALAIITSDVGSFIKLFSEAIEAVDDKPRESAIAAGGSSLQAIGFGVVPQVLPVLLSQVLYYIESNTRSATIIGIVGAGGIGLHLAEMIRTFEWGRVSFLILLIVAAVAAIDFISGHLRRAIIGRRVAEV